MKMLTAALFIVVALIHLMPLAGITSTGMLASLYGVTIADNNLEILMRHRAVLFGVLGSLFAWAAFKPAWQAPALVAGLVSVVSFLWLAVGVGGYNALLARVVVADVLALICLLLVAAMKLQTFIHSTRR